MMLIDSESFKRARITIYLAIVNVALYFIFLLNQDTQLYLLFVQINSRVIEQLELWRLFTSMFLHSDILHLISNMIGLLLFGTFIENFGSKKAYIIIYFVSGIMGNIMSLFLLPPYIISLGASGAIYGLIGATVLLIILERNAAQLLLTFVYLIYFIITSFSPQINYASHIFGLITGFLLGYIFIRGFIPKRYTSY